MGRSSRTYRDAIQALEREWSDYRRALRRRDRQHFDRLFEYARRHADAAGYQNHDRPLESVLVSVALAQQREIASLAADLEDLRRRIDGAEDGTATPSAEDDGEGD